jgi:uncharacterized membrane protein
MIGSLSRPLRVLIVVSLALNVFLVGLVIAGSLTDRGWLGHDRPPRIMGLPSPRELRSVLPDSCQATLEQALQANRPKFHEHLDALFAARQTVADAIKAEPFDPAKLATTFGTLREQDAAMSAGAQDMLVDFISKLDAGCRGKVADLLTQRHKRPE